MKKFVTFILLLMLLLCTASALAAELPASVKELVGTETLEIPQAPDFDLVADANGVTLTLTDGTRLDSVHYVLRDESDNIVSLLMDANADGTVFTYTFTGGETVSAGDYLDVYSYGETLYFNLEIVIADRSLQYIRVSKKIADGKSLGYFWTADDDCSYDVYTQTEDGSTTLEYEFDEQGKLLTYGVTHQERYARFDEDGKLLHGWMIQGDKDYSYTADEGWSCYDESLHGFVPCEAPVDGLETLEELKELMEKYGFAKLTKIKWYAKNSVCVAGLSLRDDLKISDKWYNVAPIDLTQEGTQTLYLVAGNRHHIGKAYVTVADGNVVVDYKLHGGHGYIKDECVKWFTSVDEITAEFIENPTSELKFGEPVSIEEELGGAETGILFIRNVATYRQPYTNAGAELSRYWRNRDRWIESREAMMALLEK